MLERKEKGSQQMTTRIARRGKGADTEVCWRRVGSPLVLVPQVVFAMAASPSLGGPTAYFLQRFEGCSLYVLLPVELMDRATGTL